MSTPYEKSGRFEREQTFDRAAASSHGPSQSQSHSQAKSSGDSASPRETAIGNYLGEVSHHLVRQTQARPYQAIGAAAGLGYVLAAGIPEFALRLLRVAVIRAITRRLLESETAITVGKWVLDGPNSRPRSTH